MYATPEAIQYITDTAVKLHEKNSLKRFIDDKVEKNVLYLCKWAQEKDLTGTSTELYRPVERVSAKAIYLVGADDINSMKIGKLTKSQNFMQHVIHHIIQSPILTAPVTHLVNQHAGVAVTTWEIFRDHEIDH